MAGEVKGRRHKGGLECLSDACDCFGGKSERVLVVENEERPPRVESGDLPLTPHVASGRVKTWVEAWEVEMLKGRRELIAREVLAGFARFYSTENVGKVDASAYDDSLETGRLPALCAVAWADALIAELDKEGK